MNSLTHKAGASIRRAPYVWLSATILLLLLTNNGVRAIAKREDHASVSIAIGSAVVGLFVVVVWALLPRIIARSKKDVHPDLALVFHWTYASMPCLLGVVAVVAGSALWAYWFGFAVSVILLVLTTRDAHKKRAASRR